MLKGASAIGGLGNANDEDVLAGVIYTSDNGIRRIGKSTVASDLEDHMFNTDNPHNVTTSQIGAATTTDLNSHTNNQNNPHGVTAAQVGVIKKLFNVTIGTNWIGDRAPYSQTISAPGVLETDRLIVDITPSGEFNVVETQLDEYGYIYKIDSAKDQIVVYSIDKTTTDILVQMEVCRVI